MSRFAFMLAVDHDDAQDTITDDLKGTLIGFDRAALPDKTDLRIITRFSDFQSDGPDTRIFLSRRVGKGDYPDRTADLCLKMEAEVLAGRACWAVEREDEVKS